MSSLRIDRSADGGPDRLDVAGELDISTVDDFAAAIESTSPDSTITLNLAALTFMDSSGLKALLHARSSGRELVLENVRPEPLRILQLAEVTDLFGVASA